MKTQWHTQEASIILHELQTNVKTGLSNAEVQVRIEKNGKNILQEGKRRSAWRMMLDQLTDFMVLVLIAAAIISGILGEPEDTIAIIVIVLLNAILGFVQEFRSERAMAALKAMAAKQAKVIRQEKTEMIAASELVVGDIVILEAGGVVPADIRLIEAAQLRTEEAALTGESHSIEKNILTIATPDAPIGDRFNMTFKSTMVSNGRAVGVVVATGMQTEIGHIASLLRNQEDSKTPLQKRLAHFGMRLAIAAILLCVVIFIMGILRGEKPLLMFMTALSLAVAAIPEALPAVVTLSLAIGAKRMVKQNALIRRLPAVETLGSVTYICSDKTGTLTQNSMQVVSYVTEEMNLLCQSMALNNDAAYDAEGKLNGDPTEIALLVAATSNGCNQVELNQYLQRIGELPFASERGMMTTLHRKKDGQCLVLTKGAPERLLLLCQFENQDQLMEMISKAEKMAAEGLRVLAFASKTIPALPEKLNQEEIELKLQFLGLVGLMDPPRMEVKAAIETCQQASMQVVMITGDHPVTALAIAKKLGIVDESHATQGAHGPVITGQELNQLPIKEFEDRVRDIRVYARVSPEQKINIVKALQDKGEFVAMTGDGVNDAPALKRADIGIAMGKIGTDVAREAAHMVLLDDNFSTIVTAVREGRRIFDNIRKFTKFVLTGNAAEIWTLFLAPFIGLPIPFLPIHILWVNLVTDGLPGLALSTQPEENNIMKRPPRSPKENIFAYGVWQHTLWAGLFMASLALFVGAWAYSNGNKNWQTMIFTIITTTQMFHVLAIKTERDSFFQGGIFSNLPLIGAVLLTMLLQMMITYIEVFNRIFKIYPLSLFELSICFVVSSLILFAIEFEKWLIRKKLIYQ